MDCCRVAGGVVILLEPAAFSLETNEYFSPTVVRTQITSLPLFSVFLVIYLNAEGSILWYTDLEGNNFVSNAERN